MYVYIMNIPTCLKIVILCLYLGIGLIKPPVKSKMNIKECTKFESIKTSKQKPRSMRN